MHKTFSFSDARVLNRLDEIKSIGIKPSKYISDLIIDDIEHRRITLDDLAKLFIAFTTMENPTFNNTENMPKQNIDIEPNLINDKIQSILDMD